MLLIIIIKGSKMDTENNTQKLTYYNNKNDKTQD